MGTSRELSEICEKAMESVDYQDLISPMELSEEEWTLMKKNKYLLAQTILEEGILIWKGAAILSKQKKCLPGTPKS